ncbi:hypothetical protein JL720_7233 [Aureococcus anophagefferens]|nr:hypothetical protein JL720_7233 [Aureococcus anophagefferens]
MATTSLVGTRAQARWKAAQAVDKRAPTKTERAASAAGPGRPAKMAGKVTLYITEAAARVLASSGAGLSRAFAAHSTLASRAQTQRSHLARSSTLASRAQSMEPSAERTMLVDAATSPETERVLSRLKTVLPCLSHELRDVRRRALQNITSKLEMGLVGVLDLPAHDVVAHAVRFVELEAEEPDGSFLARAAKLLLVVVERHGAGARRRDCGGVARLALRAGAALPCPGVDAVLRAVLATPPEAGYYGDAAAADAAVGVVAAVVDDVVEDVVEDERDPQEEQQEIVVTAASQLEHGWRPIASVLCRSDERRLLEAEAKLRLADAVVGRSGDAAAVAAAREAAGGCAPTTSEPVRRPLAPGAGAARAAAASGRGPRRGRRRGAASPRSSAAATSPATRRGARAAVVAAARPASGGAAGAAVATALYADVDDAARGRARARRRRGARGRAAAAGARRDAAVARAAPQRSSRGGPRARGRGAPQPRRRAPRGLRGFARHDRARGAREMRRGVRRRGQFILGAAPGRRAGVRARDARRRAALLGDPGAEIRRWLLRRGCFDGGADARALRFVADLRDLAPLAFSEASAPFLEKVAGGPEPPGAARHLFAADAAARDASGSSSAAPRRGLLVAGDAAAAHVARELELRGAAGDGGGPPGPPGPPRGLRPRVRAPRRRRGAARARALGRRDVLERLVAAGPAGRPATAPLARRFAEILAAAPGAAATAAELGLGAALAARLAPGGAPDAFFGRRGARPRRFAAFAEAGAPGDDAALYRALGRLLCDRDAAVRAAAYGCVGACCRGAGATDAPRRRRGRRRRRDAAGDAARAPGLAGARPGRAAGAAAAARFAGPRAAAADGAAARARCVRLVAGAPRATPRSATARASRRPSPRSATAPRGPRRATRAAPPSPPRPLSSSPLVARRAARGRGAPTTAALLGAASPVPGAVLGACGALLAAGRGVGAAAALRGGAPAAPRWRGPALAARAAALSAADARPAASEAEAEALAAALGAALGAAGARGGGGRGT